MSHRPFAALAVLLAIAACGGTTQTTDGGAGDGGADGSPDPCAGLGCAIGLGKLTVAAVDAQTNAAVASPTFYEKNQKLQATCMTPLDGGACASWLLSPPFLIGDHTITVKAAGYADATFTATMLGPQGCCGLGPDVNKTVPMTSVAPEALCTSTGGTVAMGSCCTGTPDFPDQCAPGPCSCSPQNSSPLKICQCPMSKCFKAGVGCQ